MDNLQKPLQNSSKMDTRYKLINEKLAYAELWIKNENIICIHQGYVGSYGKYYEAAKDKANVKSEYLKILTSIEDAGFYEIPFKNFSKLLIQINLGYPFTPFQELQIFRGIKNIIHEELCWTGNGEAEKYEVLKNSIIYHVTVPYADLASKTLIKELNKYNIHKIVIAELSPNTSSCKIISPSKSKNKDLKNYLMLDELESPNLHANIMLSKNQTQPIDEHLFWKIVKKSKKHTSSLRNQETFLALELTNFSPKEIIGFYIKTNMLVEILDTALISSADFLINGGSVDDGFTDFRRWIISRGKEIYYNAQKNIDVLAIETQDDLDHHSFETFGYVAIDAFKIISNQDLFDYLGDYWEILKNANIKSQNDFGEYMKLVQKEKLEKDAPKLFKKFWDKYEKDRRSVE